MTLTGPMFFFKYLLNGALHNTKIGCIRLVLAAAIKYKLFIFAMRRPFKGTASKLNGPPFLFHIFIVDLMLRE